MNTTYAILVTGLILTGCGAKGSSDVGTSPKAGPVQVRTVDSKLEFAVASFEKVLGKKISYPVGVGAVAPGSAGLCVRYSLGSRVVTISDKIVTTATADQLEALVWHELGHCSLNLEHADGVTQFPWSAQKYPASLMYSYYLDSYNIDAYSKEKTYYTEQLFGHK